MNLTDYLKEKYKHSKWLAEDADISVHTATKILNAEHELVNKLTKILPEIEEDLTPYLPCRIVEVRESENKKWHKSVVIVKFHRRIIKHYSQLTTPTLEALADEEEFLVRLTEKECQALFRHVGKVDG